jgi:hypothetical protein
MAACIHESGHTLVADRFGVVIISMVANPGGEGSATPYGTVAPNNDVHIAFGGVSAETRYCDSVDGCPAASYPALHNYANDNERARDAAYALHGETLQASKCLGNARELVDGIVMDEWERIQLMASAMYGKPNHLLMSQEIAFLLGDG